MRETRLWCKMKRYFPSEQVLMKRMAIGTFGAVAWALFLGFFFHVSAGLTLLSVLLMIIFPILASSFLFVYMDDPLHYFDNDLLLDRYIDALAESRTVYFITDFFGDIYDKHEDISFLFMPVWFAIETIANLGALFCVLWDEVKER